jgi:hypothetical protein
LHYGALRHSHRPESQAGWRADIIRKVLTGGRRRADRHHRTVVLGAGKRLFDGFTRSLDPEHRGVRQSPHATFIHYRVKR